MSKQISLPKISLILQKKKSQPKKSQAPFLQETLQLEKKSASEVGCLRKLEAL